MSRQGLPVVIMLHVTLHSGWNPFVVAACLLRLLRGSTPLGPFQLRTCSLPNVALQSRGHTSKVSVSHTAAADYGSMLSALILCPADYMNTFHYQTDGWFSQHSANIYETSTETLFVGRQDAMQRQALVPLSGFMRERAASGRGTSMLEVACGTGRLATFVKVGSCTLHLHESRLPPGVSPAFHLQVQEGLEPARHQERTQPSTSRIRRLSPASRPLKMTVVTGSSSDPGHRCSAATSGP